MSLFPQASLGGGVGRLKHEALREEVHRFDEMIYTAFPISRKGLYRSAAMRIAHCSICVCLNCSLHLPRNRQDMASGSQKTPHPL